MERWPGTILGFADTEVDKTVKCCSLQIYILGWKGRTINKQTNKTMSRSVKHHAENKTGVDRDKWGRQETT